ncbi:MAG: hypothetical protein MZV70_45510 [Desulfobacterales bacterium]|nr:hypothetical protein [Desulfobacterales bacterium]
MDDALGHRPSDRARWPRRFGARRQQSDRALIEKAAGPIPARPRFLGCPAMAPLPGSAEPTFRLAAVDLADRLDRVSAASCHRSPPAAALVAFSGIRWIPVRARGTVREPRARVAATRPRGSDCPIDETSTSS